MRKEPFPIKRIS